MQEISQVSLVKHQQNKNHSQIDTGASTCKESENSLDFKNKIQKGRQSRFCFERVLNFDYCILLFCMMDIILSLLYYDSDYLKKEEIAKWCLTLTDPITLIEIIVTIFRYKAQVQLQISQKILQQTDGVYSSGKLRQIIFQTCILLIQPYSFLNNIYVTSVNIYDNFEFPYKLNYILVVLGFLKMFIALRVLLLRQVYMSPRSSRLCRMYGCQSDYLYAVKCLFKDSPLSFVSVVFAGSIMIFAVCLRIAQRNLVVQYPKYFDGTTYPYSIEPLQNAIWLTIITMTTVGYGDYYPRTLFGRLIDIVLVIWGTFIVSIMVVALTNTLNMDQSQKRALIVLNRLEAKKSLKEAAAYVITHSCKRILKKRRIKQNMLPPEDQSQINQANDVFYKYLSNFQSVHRQIRSMYQIDDIYQQMSRQFESINQQVTALISNQQSTLQNVRSYIQVKQNQRQRKKAQSTKGTNSNVQFKQNQKQKQKVKQSNFYQQLML